MLNYIFFGFQYTTVGQGSLEWGGMILSVTLRSLYALVSHLCLTRLSEVAMPYSDMWQDCQTTLQHTRPCYAKSSYRSVDPQTLHGNVHQVDHVPDGPNNSTAITTMFPHCDSVEASHWSRSLESDSTVWADYALTTTTTTVGHFSIVSALYAGCVDSVMVMHSISAADRQWKALPYWTFQASTVDQTCGVSRSDWRRGRRWPVPSQGTTTESVLPAACHLPTSPSPFRVSEHLFLFLAPCR